VWKSSAVPGDMAAVSQPALPVFEAATRKLRSCDTASNGHILPW